MMSVTQALSGAATSNWRSRVLSTTRDRLPDQLFLPSVFLGPRAQWALLPSIETAGLDAQVPTHRPNPERITMLSDKCVSHFASLEKYAVAS